MELCVHSVSGETAIRRHWTSADVRALIDASPRAWPRYELINGELLVTPAPGGSHQLAVQELLVLLRAYLQEEPIAIAFLSPADLELRSGTITQPDVFVVPAGGAISADGRFRWKNVSSLLLAIEVVSPGSVRTDRVTKRAFYLNAGVPDYLVIDVDARDVREVEAGRRHTDRDSRRIRLASERRASAADGIAPGIF